MQISRAYSKRTTTNKRKFGILYYISAKRIPLKLTYCSFKHEDKDILNVFLWSSLPLCVYSYLLLSGSLLRQNVTLTYCPSLDRISTVSQPISRRPLWTEHVLWHSTLDPDPTSHWSDRTSSILYLYSAAQASSSPVFLCW